MRVDRFALVMALSFGLLAPCVVDAAVLGGLQARRLLSKADTALGEGRANEALQLYLELTESEDIGDERRGRALYGAAMAELARPDAERNVEAARQRLATYRESFPDGDRRLEVAVLDGLLEDIDAIAERKRESIRELEATVGQLQKMAEDQEEEQQKVGESLEQAMERLERSVRSLRSELKAAKAELAKKDEALEKLKQVVVEGGR
ncbi:MAG: hypothetical protein AAGN66_23610 [Acidobacteriota bacterium]